MSSLLNVNSSSPLKMSAKYPYLDIAISVINNDSQPVNYSFNSAPTIALPSLNDLAHHFANMSEGYVIWQVSGRRAFTYFKLDEAGTSTVLAITLRMDPDVLMGGRPIVNLLNTIRRTISEEKKLTHESLMRALSDSGFTDDPLRSDADVNFPAAATGLCCRSYISSTELANIMAYPRQKEYAPYQGVIVIPATVTMLPESTIPIITEPVDKALMVVCPENVIASADRVELSDHLTVTYEIAGFNPQSVEFEVGTTNRYVRINGPALVVNSALHAGVIFTRSVPFKVLSAAGNPIDTYTVLINGRTATRIDDSFEVSNTDFVNGKVTLAVSSTNYGSYSREFTPEELSEATPLEIVLEPESCRTCLRLDFGGGRIIESTILLEKSTPEYTGLRAGTFHGFRAHRLMGSSPDTYNIDLRQPSAAQPVSPALKFTDTPADTTKVVAPVAEEKSETTPPTPSLNDRYERTRRNGPVAPVMEKAPTAVWEEKTHKPVAPKFENVATDKPSGKKRHEAVVSAPDIRKESDETPFEPEANRNGSKTAMRVLLIIVAVVAVALVGWYLWLIFSGSSDSNANRHTAQGESIEQVTDSAAALADGTGAQQQPLTPEQAAAEKEDVEYLNSSNSWDINRLKSDKYRALYEALREGDIDAIASHPYFATPGLATNKHAISIVNLLWAAKGTIQEKNNVKFLKKFTKEDKFTLFQALAKIERYQPIDKNTQPRPGTN